MNYRKKNQSIAPQIILRVVIIIVLLAATATMIVFAIKGKKQQKPVETEPPVVTTEPTETDTSVTVPDIEPGTSTEPGDTEPDGISEPDADISIDVVKEHPTGGNQEPGIVGDVVIIPGIKDESEGEE